METAGQNKITDHSQANNQQKSPEARGQGESKERVRIVEADTKVQRQEDLETNLSLTRILLDFFTGAWEPV